MSRGLYAVLRIHLAICPSDRHVSPQKQGVWSRRHTWRIVPPILRPCVITPSVCCQKFLDFRPSHQYSRVRPTFYYLGVTLTMPLAQDLGYLLGDAISIVRCPQLRVLSSNASKTAILSSWVLRTQRLPKDVLRPRIEDLILYLNFILEAAVRDACVIVAVVDAFSVSRKYLQPTWH